MTTLQTTWGSDTIEISADFSQASDQVTGNIEGGYQVAYFQHRPMRAMRLALEQAAKAEGLSLDDEETKEMIQNALDETEEVEETE